MLDLPPLFAPAAAPEADGTGVSADSARWWALGNDLCQAVADAPTLMDLEKMKHQRRQDLDSLRQHARGIATTLSIVFGERRRQLGWYWPEPPVYGDGEK